MTSAVSRLFGGGGKGGDQQASLINQLKQMQEQRAISDAQGRQLAVAAQQQAEADLETALTRRKGLGRALLTYRVGSGSQPLGA